MSQARGSVAARSIMAFMRAAIAVMSATSHLHRRAVLSVGLDQRAAVLALPAIGGELVDAGVAASAARLHREPRSVLMLLAVVLLLAVGAVATAGKGFAGAVEERGAGGHGS